MPIRSSDIQGGVFLSAVPASDREVRLARAISIAALAVCVLAAPFARIKFAEVWAFMPIYQSALIVTDLITAILLFAQFVILGSAALLLVAAGYLFGGLMAVPHLLSFPRLFAPSGIIGGGAQTTAWLYMIWHSGLPLAVIAYALLREHRAIRKRGTAVAVTCVIIIAIVAGATLLTTVGQDLLPAIMSGDGYTPLLPIIVTSVWSLGLLALIVLWKRRPHSALDVWLMVVLVVRLFDVALAAVLNAGRFDVGFYVGRVFGLIGSSLVLIVLLVETGVLYARLARSFEIERDDRARELREVQAELIHVSRLTELGQMVSALAHEVNQPLTAVGGYLRGGLRLLHAGESERAEDAFKKASDQVTRASQVIQRLRRFVKKDDSERAAVDIRETIEEAAALALLGGEGRKVRLDMNFAPDMPLVFIDKVGVQQVLLNLIRNSVEAMQGFERRELVIQVISNGGTVEVSVADSGPGLPANVREKLFQPFVTTKDSGMGVGLSICRSIIEAQGGRLWLADAPVGAAFYFTLPVAASANA